MSKAFFILSLALFAVATPAATQAADQAQCESAWLKGDVNKDGQLQPEEVASLAPANTSDDAAIQMTENEFMDACKKGAFDSIFAPQQ